MQHKSPSRAFTIAELMIVLIILGVVLAVVLPSLKATSSSAKKAVSTTIMASLSAAATQFAVDNQGRTPGYFSAGEMGSSGASGGGGGAGNDVRGFPGLNNVLLDLMPGVTTKAANPAQGVIEVGPQATVVVDLKQMGSSVMSDASASNRAYFRPDPKYFYATVDPANYANAATLGAGKQFSNDPNHLVLPTAYDAFGQPILAWQTDERVPPTQGFFASLNSNTLASVYYAQNSCFLEATNLGRLGRNQTTNGDAYSMLTRNAPGNGTNPNVRTLTSILANPAFPGRARGPLTFHSAGANGLYLGTDERGAKLAQGNSATPGALPYAAGVDPVKNGDFDDILVSAGN